MGLGPSLSIRQSQQLVMTPQLRQAIQLLAAHQSRARRLHCRGDGEESAAGSAVRGAGRAAGGRFHERRRRRDEAPDDPGADDLIAGQADDDRPLDVDWQSRSARDRQLLGRRDVGRRRGRLRFRPRPICRGLARRASDRPACMACPAPSATSRGLSPRRSTKPGYLTVPLEQIAELTGAPLTLVERALEAVQGLEPPGIGARIARRMPRAAGEGGRPLRPRDGAADRQSRPAVQGPHWPT